MNPELLEKIHKVEAPDGLLGKIEERISRHQQISTIRWMWVYGIACSIVFILDISIVLPKRINAPTENSGAETLYFYPDNQLYSH